MEAEIRVIPLLQEGHNPRNVSNLLGGQEADSSLEPPEGTQPCRQLDFRTSDLQNLRTIQLYFLSHFFLSS